MKSGENIPIANQIAHYQYTADALCEARCDAALPIATYILSHPDYPSWGFVGILSALYITDKIDGQLAKKRDQLLSTMSTSEQNVIMDEQLQTAIKNGGRKDDLADKKLTHSVFGSLAIREILNGNVAYGTIIGGADIAMFARDKYVGKKRDQAAQEGKKGDARNLGKLKQLLLVASSIVAVSPIDSLQKKESKKWTTGRIVVSAGMIGGAIMSGISGYDQVKSLRNQ